MCNGQLITIAQNSALFSLLGTTYGGDGRVTFALPDLRGRVPIGMGQGRGLSSYQQGEADGVESVTLNRNQMPSHGHGMSGAGAQSTDRPTGMAPAEGGSYGSASVVMAPTTISGGDQPHENMQPYLAMNYIIALYGVFPSRP